MLILISICTRILTIFTFDHTYCRYTVKNGTEIYVGVDITCMSEKPRMDIFVKDNDVIWDILYTILFVDLSMIHLFVSTDVRDL